MVQCNKILHTVFSYETPKIVNIHSITVGVISRLVQLIIIAYIIGYVIVYKKGYQEVCPVQSSVTTKLKGTAFTNFSDDEFEPDIQDKDLYRRIWDVADYVVPPSENGATFVTTNVVITANQTQSICPEDITVDGAKCDPNNNTCVQGKSLPIGNGVMTGDCVPNPKGNFSCQIRAWCPVENDKLPLKNGTALLAASKNFTILIKNFVDFPKFKDSHRRNIKDTANRTYLERCRYDERNPECPVFVLGDIVHWAGVDYDMLAYKGGVIAIVINWDCNLDFNKKYCFPTYSFSRLDDAHAQLAPGWNFRYANFYDDNTRTLYKLYGIKFSIIVQGQAGKFMIVPLLLNVGAGLGLLALEVVICDIVVLYMTKRREYYKSKKYEDVNNLDGEKDEFIVAPQVVIPSSASLSPEGDQIGDGYQRLVD